MGILEKEDDEESSNGNDEVEYEEDFDVLSEDLTRSNTIVEAIKLIQQQQTQSIGLFEKLLDGNSRKKKQKKLKQQQQQSEIDDTKPIKLSKKKTKIQYNEPTKHD